MMPNFKKPVMAKIFCPCHLITLILSLCFADATIEIFDPYGKKVDSFMDREAFDDDFFTLEGYLTAAEPSDACTAIEPPTYLTNFTMSKFLLVNGSDACIFTTKVNNAEKAGYDVVIMYDSSPTPYQYIRFVPFPRIEFDIQLVFVSFFDGMIMKNNYLYNTSFPVNYRIKLKPNTPDITYYMYLFGAVIGVCFFVMLLFMTCLLIKCIQERRKLRRNRLSRRQIKQIPTAKFAKGDQYDVCAICLENYNEGDKLRILPCSHAYHTRCIDPWLMNNRRNCPLCKRKILFGDSGDESDSEDSELTSPAENTPLLHAASPTNRLHSQWGTFAPPPPQQSHSAPSPLYQNGDSAGVHSRVWEDDTESLLPQFAARSSVNTSVVPSTSQADIQRVAVVNFGATEDSEVETNQQGLIV